MLYSNTYLVTASIKHSQQLSVKELIVQKTIPYPDFIELGIRSNHWNMPCSQSYLASTTYLCRSRSFTTARITVNLITWSTRRIMHLLINENQDVWCYCRGDNSGKMIQSESGDCKTEWFHNYCVSEWKFNRYQNENGCVLTLKRKLLL